ncbi:MAG: NAD(P)-dependent oxidoreductase [Planctomycetota bacterium]
MKVLLTGGCGFIGEHFNRSLRLRNHEVINLDLYQPAGDAAKHAFYRGDVRDPAALKRAMMHGGTPVDHVVHLAAAHHDFGIERDTYFSVNEHGTRTMCEVMDELGIREATFYSTVAVYGEVPEPIHEDSPKRPFTPYGESKLAGEKVLQEWVEKGEGRRCLVIRPTVTFGPNNFANMYSLIRQIAGKKYVQFGKADNIKSLSYVENIIDATIYLWAHKNRADFDVYNWIDKPDLTSGGISEEIYKSLLLPPKPMKLPMWFGMLAGLPFDIVIKLTGKNLPISTARIKKLFSAQTKYEADKIAATGFSPAVSLPEGIKRMVEWYQARGRFQKAEWRQPPAETVINATAPESPAPVAANA